MKANLLWNKHHHRRLETAFILAESMLRLAEVSKTVQLAVASAGGEYDLREYITILIPYVRDLWSGQEEDEGRALYEWTKQGPLEILPEAAVTYERVIEESQGPKATNLGNLLKGGKKK
jgi:hypothetical protein